MLKSDVLCSRIILKLWFETSTPGFSLNDYVDPVEGYPIGFIGLKHVPSQIVRFQISIFISFVLENITTWVISNDQNYLKMISLSYFTVPCLTFPGGTLPWDDAFDITYLPWTEWQTNASENITFPQLRLRTVNTSKVFMYYRT